MKRLSKITTVILGIAALAAAGWAVLYPVLPTTEVRSTDAFIHGGVAEVGARFDGRVAQLHVDPGDRVSIGDLLVDLEKNHLEAELAAARAGLALAEAETRALRTEIALDARRDEERRKQAEAELKSIDAELAAARASLVAAEREFDRFRELADDGVASTARLDTAREDRQVARAIVNELMADRRAVRASIELAGIAQARRDVRTAELAAAESALEEARGRVAEVEADLASTRITAQHDGVVNDIRVRTGGTVRPGDPILSYWIRDQLWIHTWVSEGAVTRIKPGMPARIVIDAFDPDVSFRGTVVDVLVSPDGREQTLPGRPVSPLLPDRTRFAVRILPEKESWPAELLPGMSARVAIETAAR